MTHRPYGLKQIVHDQAAGLQGHAKKQVHAPLGLTTADEHKRDKLAYQLGRTWSAKGWPRDANPYAKLAYPVEHAAFDRGWARWCEHWESKGVIMRSRDQLDEYERGMIRRYIVAYARRVESPTTQKPRHGRRS